ncbi:MAG: hypothetical protein R2875_05225 [Desulfobacterales bacterium]
MKRFVRVIEEVIYMPAITISEDILHENWTTACRVFFLRPTDREL